MKKMIVFAGLMLASVIAQAQTIDGFDVTEKKENTIYTDGIETKTVTYSEGDIDVMDIYVDGKFQQKIQTKDSISVGFSRRFHKSYGRYIAMDIVLTNNSSKPFDFIPKKHLIATNAKPNGKKVNRWISADEYQSIITRRQNGNAILVGVATGLAAYGAGYNSVSTYTNVGGYVIRSTTTYFNPAAAYWSAELLTDFVKGQNEALKGARENYLKANTVQPGQTIAGHILIPIKGLGNAFNFYALLDVAGMKWEFTNSYKVN